VAQAFLPVRVFFGGALTEKMLVEQFAVGELLAELGSGLWLHSQEWLCHQNRGNARRYNFH